MKLKDFLDSVKSGRCNIAVYTNSDGNFGADNYEEGKYFFLGTNWDIDDIQPTHFTPEMPEGYLYREIIEIDGIADEDTIRKNFLRGDNKDPINTVGICVTRSSNDEVFWTEETIQANKKRPEDTWPYAFRFKKAHYDKLFEIYDEDTIVFSAAIANCIAYGLDRVKEWDDKFINEAKGMEKRQYKVMREIASTVEDEYELITLIKFCPFIR